MCRDFAAREIRPISLAVDEADVEVPREVWRKAATLGLTSFMLPAEYGGAGMTDCLTSCVVQEELSHGCAGIGNLITSGGFFAEPVLALGSAEQRNAVAVAAGRRRPAVHRAGHHRARERLRRRLDPHPRPSRADGGYVLSGQKAWISNGGVSRYYVVFATVAAGQRLPRHHRLSGPGR